MSKDFRQVCKDGSNNEVNPNKNLCALAAAKSFNVDQDVRYLHTINDLKRAIGKKYSVRSVMTKLTLKADQTTVAATRHAIKKAGYFGAFGYVVHVEGHVLTLNHEGEIAADTAPRTRDRRKVIKVYGVYNTK